MFSCCLKFKLDVLRAAHKAVLSNQFFYKGILLIQLTEVSGSFGGWEHVQQRLLAKTTALRFKESHGGSYLYIFLASFHCFIALSNFSCHGRHRAPK